MTAVQIEIELEVELFSNLRGMMQIWWVNQVKPVDQNSDPNEEILVITHPRKKENFVIRI